MLECEHIGILFLNLKKLANPVDDLKTILVLQKEMFLLMIFCRRVLRKTYQDMLKLQIPFWEKYVLQFSVQIAYLKIF